jgi:hypothetical protein
MIIKINPSEFAKPPINIETHSGWSLNLIAPLILNEFEKKKMKNRGKYINSTKIISG